MKNRTARLAVVVGALAILSLPWSASAADRMVLGEEFTATW